MEAFDNAFKIDSTIIAETYISGNEYAIPILNNDALPIIEIKPKTKFYNFDAKYNRQDTEFICPANLSKNLLKKLMKNHLMLFFH